MVVAMRAKKQPHMSNPKTPPSSRRKVSKPEA
jgi:hypothetical protein